MSAPYPGWQSAPESQKNGSSTRAALIFGIILLSSGLVMYFNINREAANAELFARAESLYNRKDYSAALVAYEQYLGRNSSEETVELIRGRIFELREDLIPLQEEFNRSKLVIEDLVSKALTSYRERRYTTPPGNNAVDYIKQILLLSPENSAALEIREMVVKSFEDQGKAAIAAKNYAEAVSVYEQLLAVIPDSKSAQKQLETLREFEAKAKKEAQKSKRVTRPKRKSTTRKKPSIARKTPSRSSRTSKPRSSTPSTASAKAQVPRNRVNASTANSSRTEKPVASASKRPSSAPAKNVTSTPVPVTKTGSSTLNQVPAQKNSAAAGTTNKANTNRKNSAATPPVVDEVLIDGAARQYVLRPEIKAPQSWNYGGYSIIKAECIVGVDGRVEDVKLLIRGKDRRLDQLAIKGFKKYRYKPATYKGKPVKFKVIESIDFVKFR